MTNAERNATEEAQYHKDDAYIRARTVAKWDEALDALGSFSRRSPTSDGDPRHRAIGILVNIIVTFYGSIVAAGGPIPAYLDALDAVAELLKPRY